MNTENRKSRVDEILATIDAGLQSTTEASYGETPWDDAQTGPRTCARCTVAELDDDGDLCQPCRAFLLGDSDHDPTRPDRYEWSPEALEQIAAAGQTYAEFAEQIRTVAESIAEALRPIAALVLCLPDSVVELLRAEREPTDDEIARLTDALNEHRVELVEPDPDRYHLEPGDAVTVDGTDYRVEAITPDGYSLLPVHHTIGRTPACPGDALEQYVRDNPDRISGRGLFYDYRIDEDGTITEDRP